MTKKLTRLVSFLILFVMVFNIAIEVYAQDTAIDPNVENQEERPGDTLPSDEDAKPEEADLSEGDEEIEDEGETPIELISRLNGVTVKISASEGVLPDGTELSVHSLSSEEARNYAETIKEDTGQGLEDYLMYDLTLLDRNGNEVQPDGYVTVTFSDIYFADEGKDIAVYHLEPNRENLKTNFLFNSNSISNYQPYDFTVNDMSAQNENGDIVFTTNHFSIYAIGTHPTATFNFYINNDKLETQIVKNNEKLVEPSTPEAPEGQKFTGWYIDGEKTPIDFNNPVTVEESKTFRVDARFTDTYYVHFVYDGNVIATKAVASNTNVDPSNVPLVVNKPGKAFSHWSTTENGTEFDFDTPITQDTTLYAVLVDRWEVTFETQGGTTVLPKHVVNGGKLGEVEIPKRNGYAFVEWNTAADGSGDTFNASSIITANVKLYAIWKAKTNTQYTVVYWQENADDDGYSYFESAIRTGTTDTPATYENKTYSGFTLNEAKTDAANVNISGDGTTVRNVYYKRNKYTLTFKRWKGGLIIGKWVNAIDPAQVKQGADTSPWWNEAVNSYPYFTWYVDRNNNIAYSLAPDMPNNDLTVYGKIAGNTNYVIFYLEDVAGNPKVREPYYFTGTVGLTLTREDYVNIPGFTVKSNPNDGSQNSVYNSDTGRHEWKIYYSRNKYDITFQKNDNTGNTTITDIPYEADISNKALQNYIVDSTTRSDGYIFKGWYDNEATAGEPYNFDGKKMPASNLILYAKWAPPVHTVKYYLTPDSGGDYKIVDNIPHGDSITEEDLEGKIIPNGLTEKDFLGWYWFVDGVFVPYDFSTPINSNDIVLHPVWKGLTYGVTYDSNGASGEVPIDNNKYILGAAAKILSPTNLTPPSDKVFIGWKEQNSGRIYYPNDNLSIAGNMILIAQWGGKAPTTSLIYYGNGGVDKDNNETITIPLMNNETHIVKPGNTFTREGYNFVEWNTEVDGSGDSFQPDDEIIVDNDESNELYAIWEPRKDISYTVNYLEQDTNEVLADQKVVEGQTFGQKVTETAIDIEGYNKVEPTEATITLGVEDNEINFYYTAKTDLSVEVKYVEKDNRENVLGSETLTGTFGAEYEIPEKEFVGYNYVSTIDPNEGKFLDPSGVVYVEYERRTDISYTVNYLEKDTNEVLADQKVVEGQTFGEEVKESAIDIVGYNKVEPTEETIILKEENNIINFYYEKDESKWHTVKFVAGDNGKLKEDDKVEFIDILNGTAWEDAVIVPETIADPGYRFKEWTPEFPDTVTKDATYTAVFEKDEAQKLSYTVEYYKGEELLEKTEGLTVLVANPVVESVDYTNKPAGYKLDETRSTELPFTVTAENNVIKVYYEIDETQKDFDYQIDYLIKDTESKVPGIEPNPVTGKGYIGETIEIDHPEVNTGYKVMEDQPRSLEVLEDNSARAIVYYEKDESKWHTVKFIAGDNGKLKEDDQVEFIDILNGTAWEDAVIVPKTIADLGYRFKEWTPEFPDTVTKDAIYTANFQKDEAQKLSYTVEYYKGEELLEKTEGLTVLVANPVVESVDYTNKPAGYKLDETRSTELPFTVTAENNVIKVYYEIDETQKDFDYQIDYLIKDTENKVPGIEPNPVTGKGYIGETIEIDHPEVNTGYKAMEDQPRSLEVLEDNSARAIVYYYKAKIEPEEPIVPEEPEDPVVPVIPVEPEDPVDEEEEIIIEEEETPTGLPDKLNMEEHYQYIQGYPDNTVKPEGYITREEVAAVFFRLLTPKYRDSVRTTSHNFQDVKEGRWSTKHIATLANAKIIEGYEDGTFRPGEYITRAELATIASRFDKLSPFASDKFSDIKNHWANNYINSAAKKGWVNGYPDGTFKPNQNITRAEFVTLVNNVLNRRVHKENILPEVKSFPDLSQTKWYYEAMQEAINSHHYERQEDGSEKWLDIYYPEPEM